MKAKLQITTQRLLLRPFNADDHAAFMTIAGDWHVARMTADLPHPLDEDDAAQWLEPEADCVRFAVTLQGRLIGGVGYYVDGAADGGKRGELGFFLARANWGRGLAVEAAQAIIAHGFADFDMSLFTTAHFVDNAPSAKVLARLGFVLAGRRHHWCRARGEDVNSIVYQLDRGRAATLPLYQDGSVLHNDAGVVTVEKRTIKRRSVVDQIPDGDRKTNTNTAAGSHWRTARGA